MTITHDAQEKAFENGQLAGEMIAWYQDKPSGMPSIADALREIQELLNQAKSTADWHESDRLFRRAQEKLEGLIKKVLSKG